MTHRSTKPSGALIVTALIAAVVCIITAIVWGLQFRPATERFGTSNPSHDETLQKQLETVQNPAAIDQIESRALATARLTKPEHAGLDASMSNLQVKDDWATGVVVFKPATNSEGGPDTVFFVAHFQNNEWRVATEGYSPEWNEWYKQSAPLFNDAETVEWINANY